MLSFYVCNLKKIKQLLIYNFRRKRKNGYKT